MNEALKYILGALVSIITLLWTAVQYKNRQIGKLKANNLEDIFKIEEGPLDQKLSAVDEEVAKAKKEYDDANKNTNN